MKLAVSKKPLSSTLYSLLKSILSARGSNTVPAFQMPSIKSSSLDFFGLARSCSSSLIFHLRQCSICLVPAVNFSFNSLIMLLLSRAVRFRCPLSGQERLKGTKIDQCVQAMNNIFIQADNVASVECIHLLQKFFAKDHIARKAW